MQRIAFLGLLSAFILLAGCDSVDAIEAEEQEVQLLPLEVGNRWVMELTESDPAGNVLKTSVDTFAVISFGVNDPDAFRIELLGRSNFSCFSNGEYGHRDGVLYFNGAAYFRTDVDPGTVYSASDRTDIRYVDSDVPFQLPGGAAVSSRHFQHITKSFTGTTPIDLDEPIVVDFFFSEELGLLQVEGFLYSTNDGIALPQRHYRWQLLEFVESGLGG
jgi:hypothetical protein